MKALHNHPEIAQMFEIVLWVTISKEGTYRNVQDELAQRFSVKREDGESSDSLNGKVCEALKAKKFLLLLDDVWDKIDLDEVGVPRLDEVNGRKVVLSTRSHAVCNKMRTDKEIKMKALSEQEAWSLFRREVGEVADYPMIEPLAKKVAMECCGLPLAIVVVGGALRKEENIHVWRNALKELSSSVSNEIEGMEEEVYRRLQYSYDRLKDARSKECFLYCALFPEDWQIPKVELIDHWITEGLIDGWNNLEEAEDKGFSKLKSLMDASLLEKGVDDWYGRDRVKMHDVMRDLELRISSAKDEGCGSLAKAGVKLSEAPKAEDWENVKRISLMKNRLTTLPLMPNCCMLTTLLLQGNDELREIPPHFFEHMPALQVLNLSGTGIKSLPPSIVSLRNLRGLYLNDCKCLKAVPRQLYCDTDEDHCRKWNKERGQKGEAEFKDLARRFEKPDRRNRWDSPLFELWPSKGILQGATSILVGNAVNLEALRNFWLAMVGILVSEIFLGIMAIHSSFVKNGMFKDICRSVGFSSFESWTDCFIESGI